MTFTRDELHYSYGPLPFVDKDQDKTAALKDETIGLFNDELTHLAYL